MKLALALLATLATIPLAAADDLTGAWQHVRTDGTVGTWIVSDKHFSVAWYRQDPPKFVSTEGGSWTNAADGSIRMSYEFDTADPARVGTESAITPAFTPEGLTIDGAKWTRIDDGKPGALAGSWLMIGRERDGEVSTRRPGARRTMKILSGTRFQWIAYNVETKEFFGSGGGTYRTADGRYTENIAFFSRDDSRSGQALEFQYDIREGVWHHVGKSTKGEPMHELWSRRKDLGI